MKRFYYLVVLLFMTSIICPSAVADTLSIDLDSASYEEIVSAYDLLKSARLTKLKEIYESTHEIEPVTGIAFRGVPWGSTKKDTESILGVGAPAGSYITVSRGTVNTDGIGIQTRYEDWTLAGYPIEYAEVNYIYPVVDGVMLRNDDIAILYLAEYDIWDIGDTNAVVEDLTNKLSKLYGSYTTGIRDTRTWTDISNNMIELSYSSSRVYLIYSSAQAEELLGYGRQAIQDERKEQEELLRIQNQNNTNGL